MNDLRTELIVWWKESKIKAITAMLVFLFVLSIIPISIYEYKNEKHDS